MNKLAIVAIFILLASFVPVLSFSIYGVKGSSNFARPSKLETVVLSGTPKATFEKTSFDFGRMEPGDKGDHTFVVKNTGDGLLTVKYSGFSCNCIKGRVHEKQIAPGESTKIDVAWEARIAADFENHVLIRTNDEANQEVRLKIKGYVAHALAVSDSAFRLAPLGHKNPNTTARNMVYSQLWDDFEIDQLTTNLEMDADFKIEKAEKKDLAAYDAKCGYWVTVDVPWKNQKGRFHGQVRVSAKGKSKDLLEDSDQFISVPIYGSVLSPIIIFGDRRLESDGTVRLGNVYKSKGDIMDFSVVARDKVTDLKIKKIHSSHEFLKVSFRPDGKEGVSKGRYRIKIELPPGKATGVHDFKNPATVKIEFDHPRVPDREFKLLFNVIDTQFKRS